MGKVLVVKAIEPNYNTVSGGPPIMMVGGGRRRGGDEPVGRTKRERLGGALGGTVGVLGALGGQHRSLGSLAQAMISGGAQGKALGGALGRKFAGRRGQARADIREGQRQENAQLAAEHIEQFGGTRSSEARHLGGAIPFINRASNQEIADRRRQYQQTQAEKDAERERLVGVANAEEMARARRSGAEQGSRDRADAESMRGMRDTYGNIFRPEDENTFNQMANQSARPIRYEVQDAKFEEDPADHSGTVQPTNAAGLPVPPQLMLPPPIQPTDHSASEENGKDNKLGNEFETNATTSALNRNKVAVTDGNDGNEDEEEGRVDPAELGRIQAGQAEPGKRPLNQKVEVRQTQPTEQRTLGDYGGQ